MGIMVLRPSFPPARLMRINFRFATSQEDRLAVFKIAFISTGSNPIADAVAESFKKFLLFI